jgi:hypothetical protein
MRVFSFVLVEKSGFALKIRTKVAFGGRSGIAKPTEKISQKAVPPNP